MDAVQKVRDLMGTALDERGNSNERFNAAIGALRLIREYELLGKKRVDVAVSIIDRITSPDFAEGVATRAEKLADSVDRILGSAKRVTDRLSRSAPDRVVEEGRASRRVRRTRRR